MAEQLGGKVESSRVREFGYAQVQAHGQAAILADIKDHLGANGESLLDVWMSHGDKVVVMPEGFALMASTPSCAIAGMYHPQNTYTACNFTPK